VVARRLSIALSNRAKLVVSALAVVMMALTAPGKPDDTGGVPTTAVALPPKRQSEAPPTGANAKAPEPVAEARPIGANAKTPEQPTRPIGAKIRDFRTIRLLLECPRKAKESDDRIVYKWSRVSPRGTPNTVIIYDDGKDDIVDSLMVSLVFSQDEAVIKESLALGAGLLLVAAGRHEEDGDLPTTFSRWLMANTKRAADQEVRTSFDGLPVSLNTLPAKGGAVALVVIGNQSNHHTE